MTTDTLIAAIRADAEAQRDADPQAVIMRLKQDLRAARQAATKARKYAEAMRDGADAALGNENVKLRGYLFEARRQRANAQRALRDAQVSISDLRAELSAERLRNASRAKSDARSATAESEPTSIFELQYPELMRAARLIRSLYAAPDGELAVVGNRMLQKIAELCEAVDPPKGRRVA